MNIEMETVNNIELHKKFINGCIKKGLDPEYVKKNYIYAGGNYNPAKIRYFNQIFGNETKLPEENLFCISIFRLKEIIIVLLIILPKENALLLRC